MDSLNTQKIIEIHNKIIKRYGGEQGILNEGSIDYLIYLLEKENDVFKIAAIVLYRLITNHPFIDGNKRTAFETAELLLRHEGLYIYAKNEETVDVLRNIAKYECSEKDIINWLKRNTSTTSAQVV